MKIVPGQFARALPELLSALLMLASLLLLSACRKTENAVAIIPRTTATILWEPMHLGATEAARLAGLRIYWNAPAYEGDTNKQLSLFEACRAKGYRGFIFVPDETQAARTAVLQAVSDHVPVVIVDDDLGPDPGPYLSYVQNDEQAGVELAAERIAHLLPRGGVIAILGISSHIESGVTREEAFEEALARRAPAVRVSVRRFGDFVVTHQQQLAEQILSGPDPIDALVTLSGTATRGAFYAKVAAEPRSTVPIVGFDQDMLLPIQTGDVDAVVVQNTREIGRLAMNNLDVQLHGGQVQGLTKVQPLLLTRQTINSPEIERLWEFTTYHWSEP
jgi:ribose transport system substrate-binding protein